MAAGEALDGVIEQGAGAGDGYGFVPGGDVGEREEPGSVAADGEAADGDEGVSGVEGSVALVEQGEVAGDVAGGFEDAEAAVEFAGGEAAGDRRGDAGEAAADRTFRFAGLEGFVGGTAEEGKASGAGGEFDPGPEAGDEGVDRADVIDVGVGEGDAADGGAGGGGEDVGSGSGEAGVDQGEAVGLRDEIAVDEAVAGELEGVRGETGDAKAHGAIWMRDRGGAMQKGRRRWGIWR